MQDQIVLVTGASSGLGLETARQLAKRGAQLVLVCRNPARGASAHQEVAAMATGKPPLLHIADLSSQEAIRNLAKDLSHALPRIDVLINNAGGMFARRELTVDGIEKTFATNYLAPFLLTELLLKQLRASPAARIVNIASSLHSASPDVLENLQGERRYNFMLAYKNTKFALIVFTYTLARSLIKSSITVNCVEPGPTKTGFGDNLTGLPRLLPLIMKHLPLLRPVAHGAKTPVYVASSPEVEGVTGTYFVKCKPAKTAPLTHDPQIAARLWDMSVRLTHLEGESTPLEVGPIETPARAALITPVRS
jgi:NAD(P)-dependent dehydrogenase (short-subunit alcohol dehydrogenase family)